MKNLKKNNRGITVMELLLILGLLLFIAAWVVRIVFIFYDPGFDEWVDGLWRSIGIDPGLAKLTIVPTILMVWGIIVIVKKIRNRR